MVVPDLEALIEDSEKASPNYIDDVAYKKLMDEEYWMQWAEKQLAQAKREQERMYGPESIRPIEIPLATNPMAGITWTIKTMDSTNTSNWVDSVPVTQTAPMVQTTLHAPVVTMGSGKINYS